jgi:hypothetical protein
MPTASSSTLVTNPAGTQATLVAPLANSTIQGSGYDILDLSQNPIATASSAYTVTSNSNGTLTLATTGSSDLVSGVMQVKFSDRTVTIEANGSQSEFIALLYQGALGRTPDPVGLAGWESIGAALPASTQALGLYGLSDASGGFNGSLSIAAGFTDSVEFVTKYGALTDAQFVTQLYANILDRAPDTVGFNGWMSQLSAGASREHVLVGFADSIEAAANATGGFTGQSGFHPAWLFLGGSGQIFTLNGTANSFTANSPGAIFNAPAVQGALGQVVNSLVTGTTLVDTAGDGLLNDTAIPAALPAAALAAESSPPTAAVASGNPPFVVGLSMAGIKTLNFTSNVPGGGAAGSAGFQGTITGLTIVNDTNSLGNLQLGAVGQGIDAAGPVLSSVTVNNYAGGAGSVIFDGFISAAAGAAANSIGFALSGALGTTAAADIISIATDGAHGTAAAPNLSYGTQTYTINSNANLQLQSQAGSGAPSVDGTTAFVFKGSGNAAIGQDFAGDHQKVTSIDASGTTGSLNITGGAAGNPSNALGGSGAANALGLFGSAAGFLNDPTGFGLTAFKLGSGVDTLDASSATATQVGALTTVAGATTAATNEIIVASAVADTTTASTFANIKGFSILGDVGAGGTINLSNLPSTINDIFFQTTSSGALVVNNQTAALTVDTEANGGGNPITVGLVGPAPGLADSFTLIVGDITTAATGAVGAVTLTGDEVVTIISQGAAGNTVGTVLLTPSLSGQEQVTIGGNQTITIGSTGAGAVADVTAGSALLFNNLTITITDSQAVTLVGATGGVPLFEAVPGDTAGGSGTGNPLSNSTNAATINASTSGGLIMEAGDANFTTSATVAGSTGDVITGASGFGNVLGGSIGNDTITGTSSLSAPDTIYTGGGADTIRLAAGHTAVDHIGLYASFETPGIIGGGTEVPRNFSITDAADVPQLGWWGQATGGTATGYSGSVYAGLAPNTGTSLDQTVVANFVPGPSAAPQDILDFAAFSGPNHSSIWGAGSTNGNGGLSHGLVNGDLTTTTTGITSPLLQQINPGNTALAPTAAGQVFELTAGTFANANAVAAALHSSYQVKFTVGGALGANDSEHLLMAYQDFSGNTHIVDVALTRTAALAAGATETTTDAAVTVHASDIVQLTGVALLSLHTGNIHFV